MDLSMPGMMALGAIFGAMYMKSGGNPLVAILIMLVIPMLLGAINGFSISRFNMIPFVVTLAMQAITSGAAIWITNQISISGLPQSFTQPMLSKVWIIPVPIIIMFVVAAIVQVILTRSIWGRWLYATGTNIRAARVSGIPTARVIFLTYAFAGLMAGIAGVILTARLTSAGATMGKDAVVLDIVSSAALGGVSIMGGVGTAMNAVIGAILITLIGNVMNMANVSYYLTLVVKGLVVVIVVAIDVWRRRR
jgi:ribose transport system permease protein